MWILAGRDDSRLLTYFNRSLPKFAGEGAAFHGAYGARVRRRFGFDQLHRAYDALRSNPDSRQVVLQVWDCTADLPAPDGQPVNADIPCNLVAMLKVRDGALHWTQIMRSNDLFRGLPYDMIQWTSVQEVLAGWLGLRLGVFDHYADSLHAYVADLSAFSLDSSYTAAPNIDSMAMPKGEFDQCLVELVARMEQITDEGTPANALERLAVWSAAPQSLRNILLVVAAEGLRRRAAPEAAAQLMGNCSNPALTQVWERWIERFTR